MSTCEQALDVLIGATCGLKIDELLDQIVRRNVMEALGRSKDQRALPALISVLTCAETNAIFNGFRILAMIRIGWLVPEVKRACLSGFMGTGLMTLGSAID